MRMEFSNPGEFEPQIYRGNGLLEIVESSGSLFQHPRDLFFIPQGRLRLYMDKSFGRDMNTGIFTYDLARSIASTASVS